jgi:hypothetical protein
MNADELVDYYIEEAKRELREDADYQGDREAFRKQLKAKYEEA